MERIFPSTSTFLPKEYDELLLRMMEGNLIRLLFPNESSCLLKPQFIDQKDKLKHEIRIPISQNPRALPEKPLTYPYLDLETFVSKHAILNRYSIHQIAYHMFTKTCLGILLQDKIEKFYTIALLDRPIWVKSIPAIKYESFATVANAYHYLSRFILGNSEDSKNESKIYFLVFSPERENISKYIIDISLDQHQLESIQDLKSSFCVI